MDRKTILSMLISFIIFLLIILIIVLPKEKENDLGAQSGFYIEVHDVNDEPIMHSVIHQDLVKEFKVCITNYFPIDQNVKLLILANGVPQDFSVDNTSNHGFNLILKSQKQNIVIVRLDDFIFYREDSVLTYTFIILKDINKMPEVSVDDKIIRPIVPHGCSINIRYNYMCLPKQNISNYNSGKVRDLPEELKSKNIQSAILNLSNGINEFHSNILAPNMVDYYTDKEMHFVFRGAGIGRYTVIFLINDELYFTEDMRCIYYTLETDEYYEYVFEYNQTNKEIITAYALIVANDVENGINVKSTYKSVYKPAKL